MTTTITPNGCYSPLGDYAIAKDPLCTSAAGAAPDFIANSKLKSNFPVKSQHF